MARTRRQVTIQEQESGVPASPPQSLPTASRSTRAKRITTRNDTAAATAATAAPAGPPPSTRGGPAVRSGRIGRSKKAVRSRAQPQAAVHGASESSAMDVDAHEAFDSSTPAEVEVQASLATPTASNGDNDMEDMEELDVEPPGETQFPTDVSAHPVQIEDMIAKPVQVEDVTAQPVQSTPTSPGPHESATSLNFKEILNSSPRSPGLIPSPFTPMTIAPTVAPVLPLESTSETSFEPSTPSRVAHVSSSAALEPTPQAPSPASRPEIFFMPSNPERSHSVITIQMNHIQGSNDPARPSEPAAFVVPSALVAPICNYIESRANPASDLRKLTTDHPVVKSIVQGDERYRAQLPSWLSQKSPPPSGSTMKDAFMKRAQRSRGFREMEEETAALMAENAKLRANAIKASRSSTEQTKPREVPPSVETPKKRTKVVPDPFTADGQLLLGRTKEIEVDEHGMAINPADEPDMRWSKRILYPLSFVPSI